MKTIMDFFYDLSQIPRGSGNEKEASTMVLNFATNLGFEAKIDSNFNVYIKKPASKGLENADAILLQGHIDMVCEKNKDTIHDFTKDPIKFVINDDILRADGTTLGADNGVAVAYMMAILSNNSLIHPPIEMLITTEEETGLGGAKAVDHTFFNSTSMINLDCGPEGTVVCGCVGGTRGAIFVNKIPGSSLSNSFKINIKGLKGGHSGADIHRGRQSANALILKLLNTLNQKINIKIFEITGGDKDNVISREAFSTFTANATTADIQTEIDNFTNSLNIVDDDNELAITLSDYTPNNSCFENTTELLNLATSIKFGPLEMSQTVIDMILVSCNIGVLSTSDTEFTLQTSLRAGSQKDMQKTMDLHKELASNFGATCDFSDGYPGWEYKETSSLRETLKDVYLTMYDTTLNVEVIHAGLECGILYEKMPHLDIVAIGPNVYDLHSPEERMEISSFERVYEFLCKVLASI